IEAIHRTDNSGKQKMLEQALRCATQNGTVPFYLSIDLDVLDPTLFAHVATPAPNGLTPEDLLFFLKTLSELGAMKQLLALEIAEFMPGENAHAASERIAALV